MVSDIFATRAEAEAVYNEMMNPKLQLVIFESTLFTGSEGHAWDGVVGHVAWGIDDKPFSWEGGGYKDSSAQYRSLSEYLDSNFNYRSGTVFNLDFGSPERNRGRRGRN